jgi:hypothetical protein
MQFIRDEIARVSEDIARNPDAERAPLMRAVLQALSWALEPRGIAAPFSVVMGTPEEREGCSAEPHLVPS